MCTTIFTANRLNATTIWRIQTKRIGTDYWHLSTGRSRGHKSPKYVIHADNINSFQAKRRDEMQEHYPEGIQSSWLRFHFIIYVLPGLHIVNNSQSDWLHHALSQAAASDLMLQSLSLRSTACNIKFFMEQFVLHKVQTTRNQHCFFQSRSTSLEIFSTAVPIWQLRATSMS